MYDHFFYFLVPDPTSINVTSDPASPVSTGAEVNLTCIVELRFDLAGLSSVNVVIEWTKSSEVLIGSDPVVYGNSSPTYISTLMLGSVSSSGNYTCQTWVNSSSLFLKTSGVETTTIMITTGKLHIKQFISLSDSVWCIFFAVDVAVFIDALPGINIAGEMYSLVCSATVTGSTDRPSFAWHDEMNILIPSERINTTGYSSTLTFNPLTASHAGRYTCTVTLGSAEKTAYMDITVESKSCSTVNFSRYF